MTHLRRFSSSDDARDVPRSPSQNLRCVVTGGAGFIGSHLVDALLGQGHSVTAVDNMSTGSASNLETARHFPGFRFVEANVANAAIMEPLVAACDHFYHLASYVGVKLASQSSSQTILNNLRAIDTVLELVGRYKPRFLLTSTSEIYGKALDSTEVGDSLSEDADRVYGATEIHRWSYAGIKSVEEFLTIAKHNEVGLQAVIVRLFNIIGPRQIGRHGPVVPRFIDQALANEPITVYGSGEQRRCFTCVDDAVEAILALMYRDDTGGEVFNIGGRTPISMIELAQLVCDVTGSTGGVTYVPYEAAYGKRFEDVQVRMPDISKLEEWLGPQAERSMLEVIREIVDHHPLHRAGTPE